MSVLRIDGREVPVRDGDTVLRAARRAGIDIPGLCDHELLRPYGACRLCMVEALAPSVHGRPSRARIVAACEYPAREALEVHTATPAVLEIRRQVVRLLLARAPEAPVLRALAAKIGVAPLEPAAEPDGCILCGLCVRVCAEAVGAHALGFADRGRARRMESPFGEPSPACIGCGACDWICPTGILHQQQLAAARFRELPGEERLCRYARLGVVPGALCAIDFDCARCDVEAAMRARFGPDHPIAGIAAARGAGGDVGSAPGDVGPAPGDVGSEPRASARGGSGGGDG